MPANKRLSPIDQTYVATPVSDVIGQLRPFDVSAGRVTFMRWIVQHVNESLTALCADAVSVLMIKV